MKSALSTYIGLLKLIKLCFQIYWTYEGKIVRISFSLVKSALFNVHRATFPGLVDEVDKGKV